MSAPIVSFDIAGPGRAGPDLACQLAFYRQVFGGESGPGRQRDRGQPVAAVGDAARIP